MREMGRGGRSRWVEDWKEVIGEGLGRGGRVVSFEV